MAKIEVSLKRKATIEMVNEVDSKLGRFVPNEQFLELKRGISFLQGDITQLATKDTVTKWIQNLEERVTDKFSEYPKMTLLDELRSEVEQNHSQTSARIESVNEELCGNLKVLEVER